MMLLNNDYYLDAKSMIMSTEINELISNADLLKETLESHINDSTLHGKDPIIVQNITQVISGEGGSSSFSIFNSDSLKTDTIVYLPINYSVSKINETISNIPHNLNSHNVVFLFVIPEGYETNENDEFILNVGSDSINFSNFYNGTIFVVGDFLQETRFFKAYTPKTEYKIEDPIKNDGINVKKYVVNLFNEIDNPEPINDLIRYENNEPISNNVKYEKIIIEGTALNDHYSLLTFNDITANVYVKNLKLRNVLKPEYEGSNYITSLNLNTDLLPSEEKFLLSYPIENDLVPILGNTFLDYLNVELNIPIYQSLSGYIDMITSGCNLFYENLNDKNGLLYILNNHKVYNFSDTEIVNQYVIYEMAQSLSNTLSLIDAVTSNEPETDYSKYLNEAGLFLIDDAKSDLNHYLMYVNDFIKSIEKFFINPEFVQLLKDRPDLVDSDLIYDKSVILNVYKERYYNSAMNYLLSGYDGIKNEILNNLYGRHDFSSLMKLNQHGNIVPNKLIEPTNNSGINTNFGNGSVKAYELAKKQGNNDEDGYFSLNNLYSSLITKIIFEHKYWSNLKNKFTNSSLLTEINDSRFDTTLCFWRKHQGASMDEVSYISFKFKNEAVCNFIIKGYSVETFQSNDKTSVNFDTSDLYSKHKNAWQFWSIRISNQYLEDAISKNYGKIGILCDVYVNELEHGEYKIKKYSLVGESNSIYSISSPMFGERSDFWKDSKIYFGYSNFRESSNENKNYFNGYFRNIMLFAGHLTESECRAIFKAGIQQTYNFTSEYVDNSLISLFESKKFFIGLIGVYNVSNINILNCVLKYNGKYLK